MARLWRLPNSGTGPAGATRVTMIHAASSAVPVLLCISLASCRPSTVTNVDPPALYINEIMAQNDSTIADTDGNGGYADWIEIYNAGKSSVDLGGMYLTDNLKQPTKWRIPDGVAIDTGRYLLFWADDDVQQGNTHTNFKLDTAGEDVGLFDTAKNGNAAIDAVTFGQQVADVSYGRSPDGSDNWQTLSVPTPGDPNR